MAIREGLSGLALRAAPIALTLLLIGGLAHSFASRDRLASSAADGAIVHRRMIHPFAVVTGSVVSLERTSVIVEVEDLRVDVGWRNELSEQLPKPASTIVWMVPDGSLVRPDEVVCLLDRSWFEEEARRQQIEVSRSESEKTAADLRLQFAQADLKSYEQGDRVRLIQEKQVAVALAQSTHERARGRLEWTTHMLGLGYLAFSDLKEEEMESIRAEVELEKAKVAEKVYNLYNLPRMLRYGESLVEQARAEVDFAEAQLKLSRERLAKLTKQIEKCTIRAPHAGRVIYADTLIRQWYQLRPGADVYHGQEIMLIPNPSKMGVQVVVPQVLARRVQVGQEARVEFGTFPGRIFRGRIRELSYLPEPDWTKWDDIPVFYATVEVDGSDGLLLPEMSARVEILLQGTHRALVIPAEALDEHDGGEVCYVLENGRRFRRKIQTTPATPDWLEVLEGLSEGERVELRPWTHSTPR